MLDYDVTFKSIDGEAGQKSKTFSISNAPSPIHAVASAGYLLGQGEQNEDWVGSLYRAVLLGLADINVYLTTEQVERVKTKTPIDFDMRPNRGRSVRSVE